MPCRARHTAYHFTQAGLTDAAIEWWGKAGDQALRRSAFQEAIAHLGKAIEMADKAGDGTPRAAAVATSASDRLKLQTSYGQAMMWSKGYAAEETKAAFSRAQELATGAENAAEQFDTYYGLFVGCLLRGELRAARETAETFLREAEHGRCMTEAAVSRRCLGMTYLRQGDFTEAQAHLEEALKIHDAGRDREAKFRFGMDSGVSATAYLAHTNWQLGEVGRARDLIENAIAHAVESAHAPTLANTYHFKALFEILRGDTVAALRAAEAVVEIGQEHAMPLYSVEGALFSGWARARLGHSETGVKEFRQALTAFADQGNKLWLPFYQGLLAEIEADREGAERALTRLDEALALAVETGEHWSDAFLHRIRGEILLQRDPEKTASAEEAFLTAIAIAQQQEARSFELLAALPLAKLYQNTNRAADAHAVLAPALEDFAPTPEFSEIEQAQTLLAALAETDQVKNVAASRQRRLKLQTSYGQALMFSRGYGAEESRAAFMRAHELAAGIDNATERCATTYGTLISSLSGGEIKLAQDIAKTLRQDAENAALVSEAAVGRRMLGNTLLYQGYFGEAHEHLEEVLIAYDPVRDREDKFRFGVDTGAGAAIFLAHASWALGKIERARELIEEATARAIECGHVPTLAYTHHIEAIFEILRGDPEGAQRAAETVVELSRSHGLALFLADGTASLGWARARLGDREAGATEIRQGLAAKADLGSKLNVPLFKGLLAEIEAEGQDAEEALRQIDEALALAGDTGERRADALLYRIRGEILLKGDPTNTAPAEEAFLTAIAVAQQQKARSFELRAAMSMARLWRERGKRDEARNLLAPVYGRFTEGFDAVDLKQAKALLDELHA